MIRMATPADVETIITLGERHIATVPNYTPIVKREPFIDLLRLKGIGAVIFLAYENDTPVGFIGGYISSVYYDTRLYAMVDPIYVVPEARGKIYAVQLLEAFENWAAKYNIAGVMFPVMTQVATAATNRFLDRFGYKETAIVYTKEIN